MKHLYFKQLMKWSVSINNIDFCYEVIKYVMRYITRENKESKS